MADNQSKISQVDQIQPIKSGTVKNKSRSAPDQSFNHILNRQLGEKSHGSVSGSGQQLPEIQGAFKAAQISQADLVRPGHDRFLEQMTSSLDLFDQYAAFLGDSDKSLKQTASILDQILNITEGLTQELKSADQTNTDEMRDLLRVAQQLLTTARVEQIKLDRGDYL